MHIAFQQRSWWIAATIASASAALISMLPLFTYASHSGNTVLVDDSDGTPDAGNCGNNANKCNTIQAGVDHASVGQKVSVAPGVYNEVVLVNKTLTIEGAQKGNDARTRSVPLAQESVVNGGFNLQANNIVLNGFLIRNNAAGAGIETSAANSGYKIRYNIIRDNLRGITLNSNGTSETVVNHNLFRANNGSGDAIRSTGGLSNASIHHNLFRNHTNSAITLSDAATHSDVTFNHNESIDDATMVNWYRTTDSAAHHNTARGFSGVDFGAISLGGGNDNVNIHHNTIRNRNFSGIIVIDYIGVDNNDINLHHNTIRQSAIHGIEVRGDAITADTLVIHHNEARQNTGDGIRLLTGVAGANVHHNTMRNNTEHDAHDDSVGTETAGTANTWNENDCVTDQPDGLCEAD